MSTGLYVTFKTISYLTLYLHEVKYKKKTVCSTGDLFDGKNGKI